MGDDDISKRFREHLNRNSDNLRLSINKTYYFYDKFVNLYKKSMGKSLSEVEAYFKLAKIIEIHTQTKYSTISQVWTKKENKIIYMICSNWFLIERMISVFRKYNFGKR